jgi:tellurite resistance protein TerC
MYKPLWMWVLFSVIILTLLILDLGYFHKENKVIGVKESLWMSLFYFLIGLTFGGFIWFELGTQSANEYVTGLLIEKSLSLDNIFVISIIFSFFHIPKKYQHRVLFWGIIGAILMRAIMIACGTAIVTKFHWVLYIFSLFLIGTGVKMLIFQAPNKNLENNFLLRLLKKIMPVTNEIHKEHFFVTINRKYYATPLFAAVISVEFVDLMFAVDSVPAIFAITLDPYIVYTSNIFAILGLRSLYFALSSVIHKFVYLKTVLSIILIFIGSKIFIIDILGIQKFPTHISLFIVITLMVSGILLSVYKQKSYKR